MEARCDAVKIPPPYFADDDAFGSLLMELEKWRGTPFVEGMGVPGQGADCVRFVEGVLVAIGAIDPVVFPDYVTRGGGAAMLEIFEGVMDAIPRMTCQWKWNSGPRPPVFRGDVFLISTGKAMHHLAIVATPPVLWHCLREVGEASIYDAAVEHNIHAVYRVNPL